MFHAFLLIFPYDYSCTQRSRRFEDNVAIETGPSWQSNRLSAGNRISPHFKEHIRSVHLLQKGSIFIDFQPWSVQSTISHPVFLTLILIVTSPCLVHVASLLRCWIVMLQLWQVMSLCPDESRIISLGVKVHGAVPPLPCTSPRLDI